jgi:hypothetical protein
MVDAQSLQSISVTIAAGGFVLALAYYVLILRNTIRTRQAQLFMQLYNQFSSKDFQEMVHDIKQFEFKDYADLIEKYGPETNPEAYVKYYSVMSFYEGIGVLIRRNLINPVLVDDMMSGPILETWGKFGPSISKMKEQFNVPTAWEYFEFLYYEIKKIVERQHGTEFANRFETNW